MLNNKTIFARLMALLRSIDPSVPLPQELRGNPVVSTNLEIWKRIFKFKSTRMLTIQFQKTAQVAVNYRIAVSLAFLILVAIPSFAQVLSGTYLRQTRLNGSRQFTFGNGNFSEKLVGEEGETFGQGTFRVDSGKLFLTYDKLIDSNASTFTMRAYNTVGQGAIVNFKVISDDPESKNIIVGFSSLDSSPIASFFADAAGKGVAYIHDEKAVGFLTVVKPNYNRLKIPMDSLRNKASDVVVKLNRQNGKYYIEPHTDIYYLKVDGTKFKIAMPKRIEEIYKKVEYKN